MQFDPVICCKRIIFRGYLEGLGSNLFQLIWKSSNFAERSGIIRFPGLLQAWINEQQYYKNLLVLTKFRPSKRAVLSCCHVFFQETYYDFKWVSGWWLSLPLWNIWKSLWDDDIPNKWKNESHVPNHQPGLIEELTFGNSPHHINCPDLLSIFMGIAQQWLTPRFFGAAFPTFLKRSPIGILRKKQSYSMFSFVPTKSH